MARDIVTDAVGNTVERAVIDGQQVFIPRDPNGIVLGQLRGVNTPLPTTLEELAAVGIILKLDN